MQIIDRIRTEWSRGKDVFFSWPRPKRIIVGSIGGLVIVLMSVVASAEYTSRPDFCPTCHYMEPYYESWAAASAHNEVPCSKCHFPPGIAGTIKGKAEGLVQVVNYLASSYTRRKPWAEIEDVSCMQSGCHDHALEGRVSFNNVVFDHGPHLSELRRGKQLRCTSCHSQIVQGDHIRVTETTCFLCHLKAGGEVEPEEFERLSNCQTCHHWDSPEIDQGAPLTQFHRDILDRGISCQQCHAKVIVGDGFVPPETCFGCHSEQERLDQIANTPLLHNMHITENKIECVQCHLQIQHKIQRVDPEGELECATCHQGTHQEQVMLFTGKITGIDGTPSPMFEAGIDCSGCHAFHEAVTTETEIHDRTARAQSCETCHGSGYNRLLGMWRDGAQSKMEEYGRTIDRVAASIGTAGPSARARADSAITAARRILHVVQIGKPVHNVTFYDELIRTGYDNLRSAAAAAGRSITLPDYTVTASIPGACANCHTGVERSVVNFNGLEYDHERHVELQGLTCSTCHSNTVRHGQVILTLAQCNACHHEAKRIEQKPCAECHTEVASIYDGSFEGEDTPDIMADADVTCTDCHLADGHVQRPALTICADCHDDDYADSAAEWQEEVRGLQSDVRGLLASLPVSTHATPDYETARRVLTALERSSADGVHNYEMASGLLSRSKRALQALATAQ